MAASVPSRSSALARPAHTMAQRSIAPAANVAPEAVSVAARPRPLGPPNRLTTCSTVASSSEPTAPASRYRRRPRSSGRAARPEVSRYPASKVASVAATVSSKAASWRGSPGSSRPVTALARLTAAVPVLTELAMNSAPSSGLVYHTGMLRECGMDVACRLRLRQ